VAPLAYLAEWRMRLAQRILREEDISVLQLAESLGYASESAFSNAFERVYRHRSAQLPKRGEATRVGG
jgi:AraC-like DNA-binding protein